MRGRGKSYWSNFDGQKLPSRMLLGHEFCIGGIVRITRIMPQFLRMTIHLFHPRIDFVSKSGGILKTVSFDARDFKIVSHMPNIVVILNLWFFAVSILIPVCQNIANGSPGILKNGGLDVRNTHMVMKSSPGVYWRVYRSLFLGTRFLDSKNTDNSYETFIWCKLKGLQVDFLKFMGRIVRASIWMNYLFIN